MGVNIGTLGTWEKEIVLSLSLLPFTSFSIPGLSEIFQVEEDEMAVFFDTIHDLSVRGFLWRTKDAQYGIKPEVAEEVLTNYPPTPEHCPALINSFKTRLENTEIDYETEFVPMLAHVKSILSKINGETLHLAQLSYLFSSNMVKFKLYSDALKYNQLAIDISEVVDKKHPVVALFYRDKSLIYKKLGRLNDAISSSLKDVEILETHSGKYDHLLSDSYLALSKTYEGVQNYEKAAEYNLKAIQYKKKKRVKQGAMDISGLYHNQAYYYVRMNNMAGASQFINKAVDSLKNNPSINKEHYKILLRDQKKFNSLFEFERFLMKYKFVILAFGAMFLALLAWAIINLLG